MKCPNHHNPGSQLGAKRSPAVFFVMLVFALIFILLSAETPMAELKAMTQGELKTATGQAGFTDFKLNTDNDTARLFLDIHIETVATIDSFSAGFYNGDWDQQWNTVTIGDSTDRLVIDGLVFIADFEDGTLGVSGTDPVLERVIIGSNRLQGTIAADFARFSGIFNESLISGGSPETLALAGTPLSRENLGNISFIFNSNTALNSDKGLFFIINNTSDNLGIQIVAGYNENSIPVAVNNLTWWDSP